MIGVIGKSVRIFDKKLFGLRRFKLASHNGNRKWVTVVGAVGANSFALLPGLYSGSTIDCTSRRSCASSIIRRFASLVRLPKRLLKVSKLSPA